MTGGSDAAYQPPITVRFTVFPIAGKTTWVRVSIEELVRAACLHRNPGRLRHLDLHGNGNGRGRWSRRRCGHQRRGRRLRSGRLRRGSCRCWCRRRRYRRQLSGRLCCGRRIEQWIGLVRGCWFRLSGQCVCRRQAQRRAERDTRRQDACGASGMFVATRTINRHRVRPTHDHRHGRRRALRGRHGRRPCDEERLAGAARSSRRSRCVSRSRLRGT